MIFIYMVWIYLYSLPLNDSADTQIGEVISEKGSLSRDYAQNNT